MNSPTESIGNAYKQGDWAGVAAAINALFG